MTEDEKLNLSLSDKLLTLILNDKIPFEKKIAKIDYLIRLGADVNADLVYNSMHVCEQELGNDELVKYIKEKGGVEFRIPEEKAKEFG